MEDISIIKNKRFRKEINVYLTEPNNNVYINNLKLKIYNDTLLVGFGVDSADFYMLIDNYNIIFINIKLTYYYPFKSPLIFINGTPYLEHMKIPNFEHMKIPNTIHKSKYKCLCCDNILTNWKITSGVYDILNDINKKFNIKLLLLRKLLCKKIINRHLETYIPIEDFL
jgi:hypothetical protein